MRSDLNKQLCERERSGHRMKYRSVRRGKKFGFDEESGSQREGIMRRHVLRGNTKSFNENLSPLWGAVRKAVGRRWDSFYSELCQTFDTRSVINQHILQHLKDFIAYDTYIKDGDIWVKSAYGGPVQLKHYLGRYYEFFVDPRDGIIKRNKFLKTYRQRDKERAAEVAKLEAEVYREVDDTNVLRKIDGVWYHFTLEKIPRCKVIYEKPPLTDLFYPYGPTGRAVSWGCLSDWDKDRLGYRKLSAAPAVDMYSGKILYHDGKNAHVWGTKFSFSKSKKSKNKFMDSSVEPSGICGKNRDMYHATKKTASHQILKKAGLAH